MAEISPEEVKRTAIEILSTGVSIEEANLSPELVGAVRKLVSDIFLNPNKNEGHNSLDALSTEFEAIIQGIRAIEGSADHPVDRLRDMQARLDSVIRKAKVLFYRAADSVLKPKLLEPIDLDELGHRISRCLKVRFSSGSGPIRHLDVLRLSAADLLKMKDFRTVSYKKLLQYFYEKGLIEAATEEAWDKMRVAVGEKMAGL